MPTVERTFVLAHLASCTARKLATIRVASQGVDPAGPVVRIVCKGAERSFRSVDCTERFRAAPETFA